MTDERDRLTLEEFAKRSFNCLQVEKIMLSSMQADYMWYWPDCPVPGCTNKTCLALDSDKCFPHTHGFAWWKHIRIWWRHHSWPKWQPRLIGAWQVLTGKAEATED